MPALAQIASQWMLAAKQMRRAPVTHGNRVDFLVDGATYMPRLYSSLAQLHEWDEFLLAGWRVTGWALGAVLWVGSEALGWVLTRLRSRTGNLAAAGVVAFGMLFRAIAVMVVVFAVAVSDKWLGLAAALTYAAGYSATFGLQLIAYFTGPKAGATA